MFAGHLGAGLILKRVAPRVGLGTLFFCAMLLDFLLWLFVWLGFESIRVPPGLVRMTDLRFDFPFSHSLLAALAWALATALILRLLVPKTRPLALITVAGAVVSHFVLDWLVHVPELPLAGRDSPLLGLGLWRNLKLAWAIESLFVIVGLFLYLRARPLSRGRVASLLIVMALLTVLTILGQASQSPPPAPRIMAATSLLSIVLVTLFAWWLDRNRSPDSRVSRSLLV